MRRGRRKALFRRERDSSKGSHDQAEIQHKALRLGKNMFRKGKSAIEGDPKKSWSGIETEGKLNKRRLGWRLA